MRTRVVVQIESMYFAQASHDQLALHMTASLAVVLGEDETAKASKRYIFSFNGIDHGVDQWLAEDGMLMQREAQSALQDLSGQMIEAMRNPPWFYWVEFLGQLIYSRRLTIRSSPVAGLLDADPAQPQADPEPHEFYRSGDDLNLALPRIN